MNSTDPRATGKGSLHQAAAILRRAARGYRNGELTWGRGDFIGDDGCRCLAAAITWAAEPSHPDGDPRFVYGPRRLPVQVAMAVVAELLTTELGQPWAMDGGEFDLIETVGDWNDSRTSVDEVVAALEAAAEILRPAALDGAA